MKKRKKTKYKIQIWSIGILSIILIIAIIVYIKNTMSPILATITITDNSQLFSIVGKQTQAIKHIVPNATLFEVIAILPPLTPSSSSASTKYVWSLYAIPNNQTLYIEADSWVRRKKNSTRISEQPYNNILCTRIVFCPKPNPEEELNHPPLNNWNIDLKQIAQIAVKHGYKTTYQSDIFITSIRRAEYKQYIKISAAKLKKYPDNFPIIILNEEGISGIRDSLILDATSGKIIEQGTFKPQ